MTDPRGAAGDGQARQVGRQRLDDRCAVGNHDEVVDGPTTWCTRCLWEVPTEPDPTGEDYARWIAAESAARSED